MRSNRKRDPPVKSLKAMTQKMNANSWTSNINAIALKLGEKFGHSFLHVFMFGNNFPESLFRRNDSHTRNISPSFTYEKGINSKHFLWCKIYVFTGKFN